MGLIILLITLFTYLQLQTTSIYGGDAGDLVSAAFLKGIPHPPGYPLYTAVGHFLTTFNYKTAAFEVGLLSSIPASFTVLFVFLIAKKLTKNTISSLVASFSLAFTYLFWLYSTVPEVFSLYLLFMTILLFLLILIREKPQKKLLYLFALVLGLSLSHHHIIFFFFPAVIYWFISIRKKIKPLISKKTILLIAIFFLIGLLPYLYLPVAANFNPPLNWYGQANLENFIRLITRADYGSFTAGGFVINTPFARLYQFKAYTRFIITEFSLVGILLAVTGFIYQYKKRREYWKLFTIAFFMVGPFFLFYAAYPLAVEFGLATYERFLLPSYIYVVIWMGEGVIAFSRFFTQVLQKLIPKTKILPIQTLTSIIFIIFPISFFIAYYPAISSLKDDRTAENLALDILNTAPPNSIVILSGDTPLFNAQYMYYTQNIRPDLILIHYSKLYKEFYLKDLNNHYPNLSVPLFDEKFIFNFFLENQDKYPIVSMEAIDGSGGFWVRLGLLMQHYKNESDIPSEDEIINKNIKIWESYHDPTVGALSQYNHLMLADTKKVYANALFNTTKDLFRVKRYTDAVPFMEKAVTYQPNDENMYNLLGQAYLNSKFCDKALDSFTKAVELNPKFADAYEQLSLLYVDCYSNAKMSEHYQSLYDQVSVEADTKLETL